MRVAYGRVSTQKQADLGSLERQERFLLEGCKADLMLLDVGSGKDTNRPQYQRLLGLIEDGQVEQILVAEQDRLNRNLQADLDLWALCEAHNTRITDLNGREIEFRTPDGELMSGVVSLLNQHRRKVYALKTRRGIEQNRKAGMPAVAQVPFGIRKVFDGLRLVGLEVDESRRHFAKQRVDKFLEIGTLSGTVTWINKHHPVECRVEVSGLRRWLTHPNLTGRLCHTRDRKTELFDYVANEQTFDALIDDSTASRVSELIGRGRTRKGLAGRIPRAFTGLCRCIHCNTTMVYKKVGSKVLYLKCGNAKCDMKHKIIREELIYASLMLAMTSAVENVARLLLRPEVDPPGVKQLENEIKKLEKVGVSGLEDVIAKKRNEVARLRSSRSTRSLEALALAIRHPDIWLQSGEWLNRFLASFVRHITINLCATSSESRVAGISFRSEIGCEYFEIGNNDYNHFYLFMLMSQEWAVEAKYKGWNPQDLSEGYFDILKRNRNDLDSYSKQEGESRGELKDFAHHVQSQLHGSLAQLKRIEPRLQELWAELAPC